jgi:uncharacterized delta-60 repeat protein
LDRRPDFQNKDTTMQFFSRQSRRAISPKLRTAKPRMVQLEDRLTPAGFGPEDGAYFVESLAGTYTDVKIQPADQKILAAGTVLARYDSLGNLDAGYGAGGFSTTANAAGLVLQPDGKAVVSATSSLGYLGAGRFNSNGSLDTTFSADGWTSVNARPGYYQFSTGIGLQSKGQIVVGGFSASTQNTLNRAALMGGFKSNGSVNSGKGGFGDIVHNQANGFLVNAFGGQFATFDSIEVQPDNKIVAIGGFNAVPSTAQQVLVARYTANGALDTTFNGSGYTVLTLPGINYTSVLGYLSDRVAIQPDEKIVVLSNSQSIDLEYDMLVTRFSANGTLDTSFGGGTGYVRLDIDGAASQTTELGRAVILQPDGKIVAVGSVGATGQTKDTVLVARLNSNGTLDATFGAGGFKTQVIAAGLEVSPGGAIGVALQSSGSIIVAGGENGHPFLMRFFGDSPLHAAGGATVANSDAKPLTAAQVQPLLTEALTRWQMAGVNVSSLQGINLRIADLGGSTLGLASGNTIALDDNAAGHGWFVDSTPGNDSEFTMPGNQGEQGKIDLLTTLMHEVGHLIGHDHAEGGVMQETLGVGKRLTPHGVHVGHADFEVVTPVSREHNHGRRTAGRFRR